jgi:hypothetical protein
MYRWIKFDVFLVSDECFGLGIIAVIVIAHCLLLSLEGGPGMGRLISGIKRLLFVVFGGIQWQPPSWPRWIFRRALAPLWQGISRMSPKG